MWQPVQFPLPLKKRSPAIESPGGDCQYMRLAFGPLLSIWLRKHSQEIYWPAGEHHRSSVILLRAERITNQGHGIGRVIQLLNTALIYGLRKHRLQHRRCGFARRTVRIHARRQISSRRKSARTRLFARVKTRD